VSLSVPEVPAAPVVPADVPRVPDVPRVADVPSVSVVPAVPDVPNPPDVPEVPAAPVPEALAEVASSEVVDLAPPGELSRCMAEPMTVPARRAASVSWSATSGAFSLMASVATATLSWTGLLSQMPAARALSLS
jgi:hypothetical protein